MREIGQRSALPRRRKRRVGISSSKAHQHRQKKATPGGYRILPQRPDLVQRFELSSGYERLVKAGMDDFPKPPSRMGNRLWKNHRCRRASAGIQNRRHCLKGQPWHTAAIPRMDGALRTFFSPWRPGLASSETTGGVVLDAPAHRMLPLSPAWIVAKSRPMWHLVIILADRQEQQSRPWKICAGIAVEFDTRAVRRIFCCTRALGRGVGHGAAGIAGS